MSHRRCSYGALRALLDRARKQAWPWSARALALSTLVAVVWFVVSPWWSDTTTFGFHDWDTVTAFRYLVTLSLREYGEFPGFNPYHCGGYPSWGYAEGATNLVSPWLPVYLYAPINQAIRIETLGMGLVGAVGS